MAAAAPPATRVVARLHKGPLSSGSPVILRADEPLVTRTPFLPWDPVAGLAPPTASRSLRFK